MPLTNVPPREGPPPETGPSVPHVQFTQTSPRVVHQEIQAWISNSVLGIVTGPSEISDAAKMRAWLESEQRQVVLTDDLPSEEALALFLHDTPAADQALLLPPRLDAEFAHLHPDGSFHIALAQGDQDELIRKGWAERHPLYSEHINVIMLYAPRNQDEIALAKRVIRASYEYATGTSGSLRPPR